MNLQHASSRLTLIFFAFVCAYLFLVINLYRVQIKSADFFKDRAHKQYATTLTVTPPRASIYDKHGRALALNKDSIAAFIVPHKIVDLAKIGSFLYAHFPEAAERLSRSSQSHFMYIKRRLTPLEIELIETSDVPDVKFIKEPSRYYPVAGVGPIVGITNIDNQGLFGIEMMYNTQLAGTPSTYSLEQDCRKQRFYITKETLEEGTPGSPVHVTLDSVLQFLAYEELKDHVLDVGATCGSVLICNPDSGAIEVMANYPDFDQNGTQTLNVEHTKNRAITNSYELGSVIKAFLALAALQEGAVTPDEIIDCHGTLTAKVNGMPVNTTKANGAISFEDVIRYSNNIGVAKVAHRLGTKLYDHYKQLGFSKRTGLFPGETPGFISPPSTWSKSSLTSLSFGYEISANIVQLAQALSIIATDGYYIPLNLLPPAKPTKEGPLYSPTALKDIKRILHTTVAQGAAHKARLHGYEVMGKTGTARLLTNGRYDPTRHIFTFMAIVKKGSYARVIVVSVKETTKRGVYASRIAVPLFERVAHKMLIHDKII